MFKKILKKLRYKFHNMDCIDKLVKEVTNNKKTRKRESLPNIEINEAEVRRLVKEIERIKASMEEDKTIISESNNKVISLADYRKSKANL